MHVLEAEGLRYAVPSGDGGSLQLLDGVSVRVDAGESVAIRGRSGSGKSTLLGLLGLLLTPDAGSVRIAGVAADGIGDAARSDLRSTSLGFVFQDYALLPRLSAVQNVALPLLIGARPSAESASRAAECLAAVGLAGREDARIRELSGGERQRVGIARALVRRPAVILADEPTGALDTGTADEVMDLLGSLTRTHGTSLVVVSHDEDVTRTCDRVLTLRDGAVTG